MCVPTLHWGKAFLGLGITTPKMHGNTDNTDNTDNDGNEHHQQHNIGTEGGPRLHRLEETTSQLHVKHTARPRPNTNSQTNAE